MRFSLYTYAWDLAEPGAAGFAAELQSLGLNGVTLACSYHAGKFMRPHGHRGRIYFPEDGTVYFRHRADRYGRLAPLRWSGIEEFDPLTELADKAPDLARTGWVVCCHNSRLGMLHPGHVAENCFGDRYIYSLNPAHPEVRAYVVALCRDLAEQHELEGLVLDNDIIGSTLRTIRGLETDAESLAIDVMREVCREGPGHYLGHADTLARMQKDYIYPAAGDRKSPKEWLENGSSDALERAAHGVRAILAEDPGLRLDAALDRRLRANFSIRLPRSG